MLTNTPLDLTPFGPLLSALGLLYWGLALGLAGFALWAPKRWWVKVPMAAAVLAAFVYPVLTHVQEKRQQHDEAKAKLDAAIALFNERCKSAGEKITRTVENVDGVVWMKWRPTDVNLSDQFRLDDPYGKDCGGEECISNLLRVTAGATHDPEEAKRRSLGFGFVETRDPQSGQSYRYTAAIDVTHQRTVEQLEQYRKNTGHDPGLDVYGFMLKRAPIPQVSARYGITWDDLSTREDREHWIAGSSLKVVDLWTKEVIAERVGYMIDRGQGSQAAFRSPWPIAEQWACPEFPRIGPSDSRRMRPLRETRDFAVNVLKPNKGQ